MKQRLRSKIRLRAGANAPCSNCGGNAPAAPEETMKKTKRIALGIGIGLLALLLLAGSLYHFLPLLIKRESPALSIKMPEGRPLRIAQFADLHFGDGESMYHNTKEERTRAYMAYVAQEGRPDLIICSGDQVMSTGVTGIKEFIAMMDALATPWVFVWGNHDAEYSFLGYSKREVSAVLSTCDSPYLLYTDGYTEGGKENRYGNFSITILDSTGSRPVGALLMLDSGAYIYEDEAYQEITPGQVDWYRQEIDRLQAAFLAGGGSGMLPTVVFAHMPLPDFSVACQRAAAGEGAEFVIEGGHFFGGENGENTPHSPLFSAMVEKGSTKAYFVGHYHSAKYQVRMDGILLGFAPQSGFSSPTQDAPRSTYIYSIAKDFSITTENCLEQPAEP